MIEFIPDPVEFEVLRAPRSGWFPNEPTVILRPYCVCQPAFVRARLKRWLGADHNRRPQFSGTEYVNAIVRMGFGLERGPWKWSDVELNAVATVLRWSESPSVPENEALRASILDAAKQRFGR